MHLRNMFACGELGAAATTKEFLAVRTEGRCRLKHYNLDVIISVDYRVNVRRGRRFRRWVTRTLHGHLV
ncbi:MAG: virulence RhuM family protein [Boseongicola sp. SB0662_bin_57]|nr:virulence RhuM family protein [Boseongicola sp. SB0662_bin_57]